jgi:hypothetical protein
MASAKVATDVAAITRAEIFMLSSLTAPRREALRADCRAEHHTSRQFGMEPEGCESLRLTMRRRKCTHNDRFGSNNIKARLAIWAALPLAGTKSVHMA